MIVDLTKYIKKPPNSCTITVQDDRIVFTFPTPYCITPSIELTGFEGKEITIIAGSNSDEAYIFVDKLYKIHPEKKITFVAKHEIERVAIKAVKTKGTVVWISRYAKVESKSKPIQPHEPYEPFKPVPVHIEPVIPAIPKRELTMLLAGIGIGAILVALIKG